MTRHVTRALAVVATLAALAAWVGVRPAQAKEWPGGYDPASGLTWDEAFRYNPVTNPFGFRGDWASPSYSSPAPRLYYGGYPYAAGPGNDYYGAPAYGLVPPANDYSYGAYSQAAPRDNLARIRLVVPADARVWFDNQATKQTGTVRHFESPALTPGREYSYDVKVTWRDKDGKAVTRTRHIDVSANSRTALDLSDMAQ